VQFYQKNVAVVLEVKLQGKKPKTLSNRLLVHKFVLLRVALWSLVGHLQQWA